MSTKSYSFILLNAFLFTLTCISHNKSQTTSALPERGLCAHRGAMATHPENTLAAFKEAIRIGAHMIEFDVQLTKDNELVIMHDHTVNRTTNGKGKVSNLTLAQIKQLDAGSWKSAQFKGEKVPTLKETLSIMPTNVWLNIHLKGDAELGKRAAQMIVQENRLEQSFLACNRETAKAARSIDPNIKICNMERQASSWNYVNETINMEADFIQLLKPFNAEFSKYTQKLKQKGIRINYYGINSFKDIETAYETGIDFPLVNDISAMMKKSQKLGIKPVEPQF